MNKASHAKDYTGLELVMKHRRIFMVNRRGAYTEIDVTAVYHFLKDFFDWKQRKKTLTP